MHSPDPRTAGLLRRYAIAPEDLLGQGMEASVYALDESRVLKLYHRPTQLHHLHTLQAFYQTIDARHLPYRLPVIEHIVLDEGVLITVEQRLPGRPLAPQLPSLDDRRLDPLVTRYLEALQALGEVPFTLAPDRYKLFDEYNISGVDQGDWHVFLARYLVRKLEEVGHCLDRDVAGFGEKLDLLLQILAHPYQGRLALLHGDFFPGNLLVDEALQVTGLVDFGLFTLFGDPLFDVATACVFFDMYDDLRKDLARRLLARAAHLYGSPSTGILYRYILIYSILSANAYAPDCSDGHYRWCVRNLQDETYWTGVR